MGRLNGKGRKHRADALVHRKKGLFGYVQVFPKIAGIYFIAVDHGFGHLPIRAESRADRRGRRYPIPMTYPTLAFIAVAQYA